MKTMTEAEASNIIPTGTYPEVVRQQMQWITKPEISETVIAAKKPTLIKHVKSNTNKDKFVQLTAVSLNKVSRSDSPEVVEHALSLQGIPYVFGGTSRSGFDCSGLTQYVFKSSGISLPRTASEQFKTGSSVSRAQLQAGDLVFFSTYAKGASHVGIYIGGGRFISASNKGVSISSLTSGYYAGRYIGARRP